MDHRLYKQASSEGSAAGSAASATPLQKHRLLAVNCPLGEEVLLLHHMQARERLSELFEYRLEVFSEDPNVDLDALLGRPMTVRLETPQQTTRYFNGIVSDFSRVPSRGRYASYRCTLRPWLWLLSRTSNCRIFQNQKAPDIIKQVFRDRGFADFKELLDTKKYREREYCVQHRETDFDFVSRLMEEEGIFHFFQHENGKHTLMLADADSALEPVPGYETVPYFPDRNEDERECIHDWSLSQTLQPGDVALNDFDFKLPRKPLHSRLGQKRDHARSDYEIYDYPGRYLETGDGEHYARVRLQELQAQHKTLSGQSNACGLTVGALLKVQYNPLAKDTTEYLISGAEYELNSDEFETRDGADQAEVFACTFGMIEAGQPFSPPRLTAKPLVQGPQTAIVTGPDGEEIHTDEHGRVKCQFHWDRYGNNDENSSCWIRVSHPWAGKNWGAVAIPRIGQEVIVDFLEGDPDQPIITGRVYNGEQKPPFPLPESKNISGIKSNSTKGGGGYNELSMDDTKGKELINIHAQFDMNAVVEHDDRQTVHNNRTIQVDGTHTETIVKDTEITVSEGNYTHKIAEGTSTRYVKGDVLEDFDATQKTYVKNGIVIKSEEANIQVYAATQVLVVTGDSMLDMRSDGTIKLSGKKIEITADEEVKIGVGGQNTTYNKQKIANSGAAINSTAVGLHEIAGALVKIN